MVEITAKVQDNERVVTVTKELGENINQKVEMFGEDIVNSAAEADIIRGVQNKIRAGIKAGLSNEEIQDIVTEWKPGVVTRQIFNPLAAFEKFFTNADPEKQRWLREQLEKKFAQASV